jgi:antitoxin ParD1/3/4
MKRTTSYSLGPDLDAFVRDQVESHEYGSASEVIRAALATMREQKRKEKALAAALDEGVDSGRAPRGTWERVRVTINKRSQ